MIVFARNFNYFSQMVRFVKRVASCWVILLLAADTNLGTNLTLRDVQVLGSLVQKVTEGLQVFV